MPSVRHSHVELFDVTCLCGQRISGQRLPCPQAIECPSCGEALFVLPVDAYPAPDSRARERLRRGRPTAAVGRGRYGKSVWRWLTGAPWPALAIGRVLLLSVVGVMTAGLIAAFWLDAQSRQRAAPTGEASHNVGRRDPSAAVYRGRVHDGTIILDGEAALPEGTRVSIRVVPATESQRAPRSEPRD